MLENDTTADAARTINLLMTRLPLSVARQYYNNFRGVANLFYPKCVLPFTFMLCPVMKARAGAAGEART